MGFLTSLFGGGEDGMSWWGAGFALIIVLVLIVGGLWALKLLFKASGSVTRGRQRRLAVIDTLNIDAKRSLVLIRRDNVEHLLVLGGTHDVVVEAGISNTEEQPAAVAPSAPKAMRQEPAMVETEEPDRRRKAAASRLGLTGLLRRYNDPQPDMEPEVETPEPSPLERLKNLGQPEAPRSAPSLRHTGLLRPASNDDDDEDFDEDEQSTVEEPQIPDTVRADSAKNGANPWDDVDIASTQEEAAADDADSDDADEFAAQAAEITVDADEFAPEVSIDPETTKSGSTDLDNELDEDATEPAAPRTQH